MGFRAASASARERVTIGLGGGMFLWGALAGHVYPAVMIVLAVRSRRLAPVAA
ncbi:hypothetical protein JYK18_32600 [Amycolatopsis sp. 195334CR]|nr:hypothetical protein [Amycolatopsis sp. 195334CR]